MSVVESPATEFLELAYYETFRGTGEIAVEACENLEPEVTVCHYSSTGEINATHLGRAIEVQTGSARSEPCIAADGSAAMAMSRQAGGTITSQSGDQLFFQYTAPPVCGDEWKPPYWAVIGGTGRFEDASGTMSAIAQGGPGDGSISVGTLRVRADRYEEFQIHDPSPMVMRGVVGVMEGDDGAVAVEVPVTLSYPAPVPVTVAWQTVDTGEPGIATGGVDYVAASGSITFEPGEIAKTASVTVNGDSDLEEPAYLGEWGLVELSSPSPDVVIGGGIDGYAVFVIGDDD